MVVQAYLKDSSGEHGSEITSTSGQQEGTGQSVDSTAADSSANKSGATVTPHVVAAQEESAGDSPRVVSSQEEAIAELRKVATTKKPGEWISVVKVDGKGAVKYTALVSPTHDIQQVQYGMADPKVYKNSRGKQAENQAANELKRAGNGGIISTTSEAVGNHGIGNDRIVDEVGNSEGVSKLDDLIKTLNLKTLNSTELIDIIKKSPPLGKELILKISKEFGTSIKANPLRQAYENEVTHLSELAKILKSQGKSEEAIARQLSQMRRDLGVKYKDLSPQLLKEHIYDVNVNRYEGDPLGPTVEYFLRKGKSWSEIIDSACRPNPNVDVLLGGFEKWMRTKCNL